MHDYDYALLVRLQNAAGRIINGDGYIISGFNLKLICDEFENRLRDTEMRAKKWETLYIASQHSLTECLSELTLFNAEKRGGEKNDNDTRNC